MKQYLAIGQGEALFGCARSLLLELCWVLNDGTELLLHHSQQLRVRSLILWVKEEVCVSRVGLREMPPQ